MFATSLLLDLEFIYKNWVRYWLVVLLILCELAVGFLVLKGILNKNQK